MLDEQVQRHILDFLYDLWLNNVRNRSCLKDLLKTEFKIEEKQLIANANYLVDKFLIERPSTIRYCTRITIDGIILIELTRISSDFKKRIETLKYLREKYNKNPETYVNSNTLLNEFKYSHPELERIIWYLEKVGKVKVRWYGGGHSLSRITDMGLDSLSEHSILEQEANIMAYAYSKLYKLENELRIFYEMTLRERYGNEWWDEGIPFKVKKKAENTKKNSQQKEKGEYSQIFYTDFEDLKKIPNKDWDLFKKTFRIQSGVLSRLGELEPIRNKIAHSRFLDNDELSTLELFFKQITELLS